MKFEEAYDKVFELTPKELIPKGDNNYPKLLAFLWSMLAVSKNVLDDICYIDENMTIKSVPVQKSSSKQTASTKKAKDADKKIVEEEKTADGSGENSTNS